MYIDKDIGAAMPRARPALTRLPLPWPELGTRFSSLSLMMADAIALAATFLVVSLLREWIFGPLPPLHFGVWGTILAWFAFRQASELYAPHGLPPPERLRRSFGSSFGAVVVHSSLLMATGEFVGFRVFALIIWVVVLPCTYTLRGVVRRRLIAAGTYGVPIAIIGDGVAAKRAVAALQAYPDLGYVPIAVFSTGEAELREASDIGGVPVVGRAEQALTFDFGYTVTHAMLTLGEGWDDDSNQDFPRQLARRFSSLQSFTKLTGQSLWLARTRAIGSHLSIETRYVRFGWQQWLIKRALDITISLPVLLLSSPVIFLAALAIVVSNPGPVFFSQTREGRHGKAIKIYKLRTMVTGAEGQLARHLEQNPAAKFEYERTLKLRADPRIIPFVGRFIRAASIDEVPQLWNVLKGDMSLVGPRVMPTREVDLYTQLGRELRRDMLPGLTGFWQVEHRNNSDFSRREVADSFYVSNWSIWLDIWILLRTVRAVLSGAGAS